MPLFLLDYLLKSMKMLNVWNHIIQKLAPEKSVVHVGWASQHASECNKTWQAKGVFCYEKKIEGTGFIIIFHVSCSFPLESSSFFFSFFCTMGLKSFLKEDWFFMHLWAFQISPSISYTPQNHGYFNHKTATLVLLVNKNWCQN